LKPIIIDMNDLSECTEIYEKKPNPAIVLFVYVLLGITVISLIWMALSKIDIVTEGEGVICDIDGLAYVTCDHNARITKCLVTDGQRVTKGDVLFEMEVLANEASPADTALQQGGNTASADATALPQDGKFKICANDDGYFYSLDKCAVGEVFTAESHVGNIYPESQKAFQAQMAVSANDVAKLREGQEVKFELTAYPINEYGTLTGHIRKIGKEAVYDQQSGMSYFIVWVDCDAAALTSKTGETVSLLSGLPCHAKIVTGRKTVLKYVMESIL